MEELKKENGLLLKLVSSLQSQISSKTRENQLLFQQYEQLALENKAQAAEILTFKNQNRDLRRASFSNKDQPRYTYAVLNSPRTEKLIAELEQAQLQLANANQENQKLALQLEQLKSNSNNLLGNQKGQDKGDNIIAKSSEKIEELQRCLVKKEKQMKELTLIMYAKDVTTSEISLKQEGKNREIEELRRQINAMKEEKHHSYAQMKKKEEQAVQQTVELQQQIKELEKIITSFKTESARTIFLEESLRTKQHQISELQSVIATKSDNLQQLSIFMNEQAEQLQNALEKIASYQEHTHEISDAEGTLAKIEETIKQKEQLISNLEQKIKDASLILHENQQSNSIIVELMRQSQNEIGSYQQIKDNLLSQLQHYNKQILFIKQELASHELQSEKSQAIMEGYKTQINSCSQSIVQLKQQQNVLNQQNQQLQQDITQQKEVLNQIKEEIRCFQGVLQENQRADDYRKQMEIEMAEKEESITAFMDVLDNLHHEIKIKDAKIQLLANQTQQLAGKCSAVNQQCDAYSTENQSLRMQNHSINIGNEELTTKLKVLNEQTLQMKRENSQISLSLNDLVTENQNLKAEIESLEKKIVDLNFIINQKSTKITQLESTVSLRREEGKAGWRQRSTDGLQKQQYIQMLNAVIESIKNEHEESITKIQTKNHIINELQKRLEQAEENYNAEITNLRNSIACQEVFSYDQIAARFPQRPTSQEKTTQEELDELLAEIQALRHEIKQKDEQLQQLREANQEEEQEFEDKVMSPITQTLEDNNSRPISNIQPMNDSPHHFDFISDGSPSQIELENQSLHETIEAQNCTILQLQDNLMRAQHAHNSQVMALRRNIAELNAEVLQLKRTLYEANPKALDITAFAKERNKKEMTPTFATSARMAPSPSLTTNSTQSLLSKKTLQDPKKVSPKLSIHSNPYIAKMTNEKGELRFPESGSWSIQELRNLLQQ